MEIVVIIIGVLVAAFANGAAGYKKEEKIEEIGSEVIIDSSVIDRLAMMIQIPTISYDDYELMDKVVFKKFVSLLKKLYPNVHQYAKLTKIGNTGLLYLIKGKSKDEPIVLMSHYDVVPVDFEKWKRDPFSGEVVDGEIWGRGTIDTKISLLGVLEATEKLLSEGFIPNSDLYLSFGGDEEVGGPSAIAIVDYLEKKGIKPKYVLDEGGAIVNGFFPTVKEDLAVIGIAEKGMCNIKITAYSDGGHASKPLKHSAVGKLAKYITRLENKPSPLKVTKITTEFLDTLGRYTAFPLRMIFGNMWFFRPFLGLGVRAIGGELKAMNYTTQAVTMCEGSSAANVLPTEASCVINYRILPGDSVDKVVFRIRKIIKDPTAKIEVLLEREPSTIASTTSVGFENIKKSINQTFANPIVTPYLMIACSDSAHFSRICQDVYKFSPMKLNKELLGTIHNDNERISTESVIKCVEFYYRLIKMH